MLQSFNGPVITGNEANGLGGTEIVINQGLIWGHTRDSEYLSCAIYHPQEGTLIINNGTFRTIKGIPLVVRAGQININDGTFIPMGGNVSGKIKNSENILDAATLFIDGAANYSGWEDCYTVIENGTFSSVAEDAPIVIITAPPGEDSRDYLEVNDDSLSGKIEYR